jgi:Bifunctional DNA primase/polymerase, N-terminal
MSFLANEKPSPLVTVEGQDSLTNNTKHTENSVQFNDKLADILALAELGRPVFPANKDKRPMIAGGLLNASTDRDRITAWWASYPDALVAVATGSVSDLSVVDLDVRGGARGFQSWNELIAKYGEAPETLTAETRSGGRHLYFRFVPGSRCSASKLGPGIDIRSDGGCVIAPPSQGYRWLNPGAEIAVAPAWLQLILAPSRITAIPREIPRHRATGDVVERARKYLAKTPPSIEHNRGHSALLWAARVLVWGFALPDEVALELLREYNDRGDPESEIQLRHKINSAGTVSFGKPRGWLVGGRS